MTQALILKVTLEHRKPLTWRRLAVPMDTTYAQLHDLLQLAFGWEGYHLYAFYPAWNRNLAYEDLSQDTDASGFADDASMVDILPDLQRGSILYEYDFGESWDHRIKLEATRDEAVVPACLAGRGNGFLEDGLGEAPSEFDAAAITASLQGVDLSEPDLSHIEQAIDLDISQPLALFEQSGERKQVADMPSDLIKSFIVLFVMMMDQKPLKQWTQAALDHGFDHIAALPDNDDDSLGLMIMVLGDFLQVMARHHLLGATADQVDAVFETFVDDMGLLDQADDTADDDSWADVEDEYGARIKQFLASVKTQFDPEQADSLLRGLLATMLDRYDSYLDEWDPADLEALLTDYYPAHVVLDDADWPVIAPVTIAFVQFMHQQHMLSAKIAKRIVATINHAAPKMLQAAADPSNWGPGKQVGMQMQAAGVDPSDQEALGDFIDQYNASLAPVIPPFHPRPHVMSANGKTWRQATATRVHNEAGDLASQLEVDDQDNAVAMIVDFVDQMYATTLLTPLHWQEAAISKAWQAHLAPLLGTERKLHSDWLRTYCTALGATTSMTQKQAKALVAAIDHAAATAQKPVGKVSSNKQARKLLKFKPKK